MNDPVTALAAALGGLTPSPPLTDPDFLASPGFANLRAACERLYPNVGAASTVNYTLNRALRALGYVDTSSGGLVLDPLVAAARLDAAFHQTSVTRTHFCPLDLADTLPDFDIGGAQVRTFSKAVLREVVTAARGGPLGEAECFDVERFSEFAWLIVRDTTNLPETAGQRAFPELMIDFGQDFGRIEPHRRKFPESVERALFRLLTLPWEDHTEYASPEWRPFYVPWVFTVEDDLFGQSRRPPSPDTLAWETGFLRDVYGQEVEVERPVQIHLEGEVTKLVGQLSTAPLSNLDAARGSALFGGPVEHFFVRAFLSDGIDEFLAHVTCIEAALGTPADHERTRSKFGKKQPGATARVAARVGVLLADDDAAQAYLDVFQQRSMFLHGRNMGDISTSARKAARRLTRRVVTALIAVAAGDPVAAREAVLEDLLQAGMGAVLARAGRAGAAPAA